MEALKKMIKDNSDYEIASLDDLGLDDLREVAKALGLSSEKIKQEIEEEKMSEEKTNYLDRISKEMNSLKADQIIFEFESESEILKKMSKIKKAKTDNSSFRRDATLFSMFKNLGSDHSFMKFLIIDDLADEKNSRIVENKTKNIYFRGKFDQISLFDAIKSKEYCFEINCHLTKHIFGRNGLSIDRCLKAKGPELIVEIFKEKYLSEYMPKYDFLYTFKKNWTKACVFGKITTICLMMLRKEDSDEDDKKRCQISLNHSFSMVQVAKDRDIYITSIRFLEIYCLMLLSSNDMRKRFLNQLKYVENDLTLKRLKFYDFDSDDLKTYYDSIELNSSPFQSSLPFSISNSDGKCKIEDFRSILIENVLNNNIEDLENDHLKLIKLECDYIMVQLEEKKKSKIFDLLYGENSKPNKPYIEFFYSPFILRSSKWNT